MNKNNTITRFFVNLIVFLFIKEGVHDCRQLTVRFRSALDQLYFLYTI